jgi:hypothetical protein
MKFRTMLLSALAAAFLAGCEVTLIGLPPAHHVPAGDADFTSLAGERYEKYVFVMEPGVLDKKIQLPSARVLADTGTRVQYQQVDTGGPVRDYYYVVTRGILFYNTLALETTLRALVEGGSAHATGSAQAFYAYNAGNHSGFELVSGEYRPVYDIRPFDKHVAYPIDAPLALDAGNTSFSPEYERYGAIAPFSSRSMTLPLSGSYSSAYSRYETRTFTVSLSAGQFDALYSLPAADPSPPQGYPAAAPSRRPTAVSLSVETFERYVLASRGFYQYKNFAVSYDPGVMVFAAYPQEIVQSFHIDAGTSTLHVTLRDYDEPYAGRVITYWIMAEDGTVHEKTVSIGG